MERRKVKTTTLAYVLGPQPRGEFDGSSAFLACGPFSSEEDAKEWLKSKGYRYNPMYWGHEPRWKKDDHRDAYVKVYYMVDPDHYDYD